MRSSMQHACKRASAHLEVLPELHDVCHVNFVEGGQHGVGVLGPLEAFSHARSQAGHLHTPLWPPWLTRRLV